MQWYLYIYPDRFFHVRKSLALDRLKDKNTDYIEFNTLSLFKNRVRQIEEN
jgi:hypothetical protein